MMQLQLLRSSSRITVNNLLVKTVRPGIVLGMMVCLVVRRVNRAETKVSSKSIDITFSMFDFIL